MPINHNEIMCKTCRAFRPSLEMDIELSGQLEAAERPYGTCFVHKDRVREDEWCGSWEASIWMEWVKEHERHLGNG